MRDLGPDIASIAALDEPARRALYAFVTERRREVGRDEAAIALGMKRSLAAFHLDALVDAGLLVTSFRRLGGRTGPGAGRPAKLYRRSTRQVDVTLPARRYEVAADLLASALEADDPRHAVGKAARSYGRSLGAAARDESRRPGRAATLAAALDVLARHGFEPAREGDEIRLGNCPFDALAQRHQQLVCGMNLELMQGFVAALGISGLRPVLDPRPGVCCVALRSSAGSRAARTMPAARRGTRPAR